VFRIATFLCLFAGGCLQDAKIIGGPDRDLGADAAMPASGGPSGPGTPPTPAYFNPDIQHDLDSLGCTNSACHGGNASPQITAMPSTLAAWMSNYTNIHIDCSTLDCLGGGDQALLLQKPLQGGITHTGIKPFANTSDPTYQRWRAWISAGAPYDAANSLPPPSDMAAGPSDLGSASDMLSKERVSITFTTSASPDNPSPFAPRNVVAVWIENSGTFVKTAGRWANARRSHLVGWIAKAGNADVDSISGASQQKYGTLTATWDMTARAGGATPGDGTYTIRMELADNDSNTTSQNNEGTFTFNRNGTASTQTGLSNGGFSAVNIQYTGR
jgi:hypothetical protein